MPTARSQNTKMVDGEVTVVCPSCQKELYLKDKSDTGHVDPCPHATTTWGVIRFGEGYSDDVAAHRVAEVATEEAREPLTKS